MKTSIYVLKRGNKTVTLLGCMHIGSKEYYDRLNTFATKKNTVVLYEGCGDDDDDDKEDTHDLYRKIATIMGLEYQGDAIKYDENPQWINSDINLDVLEFIKNTNIDFSVFSRAETALANIKPKQLRLLFDCSFIIAKIKTIKPDPVLVVLRNYIVFKDLFEKLIGNDDITVLYGEAHLNHMVKQLKAFGFSVIEKNKIDVWSGQ